MVVPTKIDLVERKGCAFCQNICQYKGNQARSDSSASKETRKYMCNSEIAKFYK